MSCPDVTRLIDLARGSRDDEALLAHVLSCESCRRELTLIWELPSAFRPEREVPGDLVQRVMDRLVSEEEHRDEPT